MPWLIAIVVMLLLWDLPAAQAWGPGTHIELARSLLSDLAPVAGAAAGLISRYARDFLYGNVAADVVQAKRFIEAKKHCHNWSTGFRLLENARDDHTRAFALGYLCHLAADCVAHNKFVPRQMMLSRSTSTFGHGYWEMRADALMPATIWPDLRGVVTDHWPDHDELMETQIAMPLFSFEMHKRIFTRVSLLGAARSWRRGVRMWTWISRWPLSSELLIAYMGECRARMRSVLLKGDGSPVLAEDPTGAVSFGSVKVTRRLLRQMAAAGILRPQVLDEAVAHLAPSTWPADGTRHRHSPSRG